MFARGSVPGRERGAREGSPPPRRISAPRRFSGLAEPSRNVPSNFVTRPVLNLLHSNGTLGDGAPGRIYRSNQNDREHNSNCGEDYENMSEREGKFEPRRDPSVFNPNAVVPNRRSADSSRVVHDAEKCRGVGVGVSMYGGNNK